MLKHVVIGIMLTWATVSGARTIIVGYDLSADYYSLQEGVKAANNGDEIVVLDNLYSDAGYWDIQCLDKDIVVRSANGPAACVIDCRETATKLHRVFYSRNQGLASVIEGFTIRNGSRGVGGMGGAILCHNSDVRIKNCIFVNNFAPQGGAIATLFEQVTNYRNSCQPLIENCTFTNNTADQGGALYCGELTHPQLINCILWNDTAVDGREIAMDATPWKSNLTIQYCDLAGGSEGISGKGPRAFVHGEEGILTIDPGFVDPNRAVSPSSGIGGDYHLKSGMGRWNAETHQWVQDTVYSPCIDGGATGPAWAAETWPNGLRVNMGAFGGTAQASRSPEILLNLLDPNDPNDPAWDYLSLRADLTGDWRVDDRDLEVFTLQWMMEGAPLVADFDESGLVDDHDREFLLAHWQDTDIPEESPLPLTMAWDREPEVIGDDEAVEMTAVTAFSTDGSGVQYWFESVDRNNSGWISFAVGQTPRWVDETKLTSGTTYYYRVKARNRANKKETNWSSKLPPPPNTPPTPDPASWMVPPKQSGERIYMESVAANSASPAFGVEYAFTCTTHPTLSRDWQESPIYQPKALGEGEYTFKVKVRDQSSRHNETEWSDEASVEIDWSPSPSPAQWSVPPKELDPGLITMKAVTAQAIDPNHGVQYRFYCTSHEDLSSQWQDSTEYQSQALATGNYTFQVRARDKSLPPYETKPSIGASVYIGLTPSPSPTRWSVDPQQSGKKIYMQAVEAQSFDPNGYGVEYKFTCTSHPSYSSAWQPSRDYELTAPFEATFDFVVSVRDTSPGHNETSPSVKGSVSVDLTKPTPNPMLWAVGGTPSLYNPGPGTNWHITMTAKVAADVSTPVQYFFECRDRSDFSSAWQESPTFTVRVGTPQPFIYRVKAKDHVGNETDWSEYAQAQ